MRLLIIIALLHQQILIGYIQTNEVLVIILFVYVLLVWMKVKLVSVLFQMREECMNQTIIRKEDYQKRTWRIGR